MPKTFTASKVSWIGIIVCGRPCGRWCTPSKVTWIGIIVLWNRNEDMPLYIIFLSWSYYWYWHVFCWVLTQTTLVENTRLNAEYLSLTQDLYPKLTWNWHFVCTEPNFSTWRDILQKSAFTSWYLTVISWNLVYQGTDNFFKFQHTSILESKTAKNQLGTLFLA